MTDPRFPTLSKQTWPHESVAGELDAFYGDPRGSGSEANPAWEAENITHIAPPWSMNEDGANVTRIAIHRRCADSLQRVLNAVWAFVGQDQSKIDASHLNEWGGSYNYRVNRNNPAKLSVHGYAAAIDIAPNENPNGQSWSDNGVMLPRWFIDAFLAEGWSWGGDFGGTKDAMHFQATFNAHSDAPKDELIPQVVIPAPSVVIPNMPIPIEGVLLSELRQFLLEKTGVTAEVEAFKADILKDLINITNKIQAFALVTTPALMPVNVPGQVPSVPSNLPTESPQIYTNITATTFGGPGDEQPSAYLDVPSNWASQPGCALPYHFPGKRPLVKVYGPNGKTIIIPIVDVGPWYPSKLGLADQYWLTPNARPRAESDHRTNQAGIDLTDAAATFLGINGKGKVNWSFVYQPGAPKMSNTNVQSTVTVPVTSPLASKINWTAMVQLVATLLTVFTGGKINLSAEQQVAIIGFIGTIGPVATMLFRTFGTTSVTPQSLSK